MWSKAYEFLQQQTFSKKNTGYNSYAAPILLNGEEYNLSVVYDFEKAAYEMQGARKPIDESGMANAMITISAVCDILERK